MIKYAYLLVLGVACYSPQSEVLFNSTAADNLSDSVPVIRLNKLALLGKIEPASDSGFVLIPSEYTDKEKIYLRSETYQAFARMAQAAQEAGINLQIISATRNFEAQKGIWEAKWNGQRKVAGQDLAQTIPNPQQRALKILEYSSMPGTSRHHWGTDIDLNDLTNSYFAAGKGQKVYTWLRAHASDYGFCQVYTEQGEDRPDGYHEEKWHWSYLPLAQQFLQQYHEQISYADIKGFEGSLVAEEIGAIEKYVNGIAPQCRDWMK